MNDSFRCAIAAFSLLAASTVPVHAAVSGGDQVLCAGDGRPCVTDYNYDGSRILIRWRAGQDYDLFNVRWSRPGRADTQFEDRDLQFVLSPVHQNTVYSFKVQSCVTHTFGSSDCTAWEQQDVSTAPASLPNGPDTCKDGYVWREAFAGDHVCVTPQTRTQTARDNAAASYRRSPRGGDFGHGTCLPGYVWREANTNDHVCVPPETRAQATRDNAAAASLRAS